MSHEEQRRLATLRLQRACQLILAGRCRTGWQMRLATGTASTCLDDLVRLGHGRQGAEIITWMRQEAQRAREDRAGSQRRVQA